MLGALLFAALVGPQAAPNEPRAASSELKVVVTTAVYQPDGAVSIETTVLHGTEPSIVHLYGRKSVCDTTAGGATEPTDATFGWRLAARTLRAGTSAMIVSVDWLRLWDRGQRLATGPSGTVQLTLHPGDRIPLDYIPNPLATEACRAVGMGLEMRLARTTATGPPGSMLLPLGGKKGGAAPLDADLWLVHTLPAGTVQAQHQRVRLTERGAAFSFPAVSVATTQGDVAVEISGSLRRFRTATGAEFVLVSMARALSGGALASGGVTTGTGTMIALPGPTDVLSLELPTSGGGGGARSGGGRGPRSGFGRSNAPPGSGGVGAGPIPGGAGGGGGGQGAGIATGANASSIAQAAAAIAGHAFSLRLRLTPVPGM